MHRKVELPVGVIKEGQRYKTALLQPLTGKALLAARSKIGDNPNPVMLLDILRATFVGFDGLKASVKAEDLAWADADYIFRELAIWEHEESGEPMSVRRKCGSCGAISPFPVDPAEQESVKIEDTEFGKYPDLQIPFKLRSPLTTLDMDQTPHDTGRLGLLTTGDEIDRMKRFGNAPGKFWTEGLRLMISELGPKKKGDLSPSDVEQLSAEDIKKLESTYTKNEPGLKPFPSQTCPACRGSTDLNPQVLWVADFLLFPQVG